MVSNNMPKEIKDDIDDTDVSSGGTDRKPFAMRGCLVQGELAKGEKAFGDIDWSRRETEPPPEETQEKNYSEEASMAAANQNVAQTHPFLATQQFDGRDAIRDLNIPSMDDVEAALNDPKLVLSPELKLALENAKRYQMSSTPTLKPAGGG